MLTKLYHAEKKRVFRQNPSYSRTQMNIYYWLSNKLHDAFHWNILNVEIFFNRNRSAMQSKWDIPNIDYSFVFILFIYKLILEVLLI